MNFDNFLFRCSSLGYLMQPCKGKSYGELYDEKMADYKATRLRLENYSDKAVKGKANDNAKADRLSKELDELKPLKDKVKLSDTAKTHLCDIYTAVKDGRKTEDIRTKYIKKGLHMEEDAITLYSLVTGLYHKKSSEERSNDYITGHIDFPTGDNTIVDTKVNWSIFQFNRVVAKPINPIYKWQGKGYMWLWDKDNFELAYCLLNTPQHLLETEERYLTNGFVGTVQELGEAIKELRHNHTYDDKPNEEKIRIYKLKRNRDDEELIKRYVMAGREYLNNFGQDINEEE